MYEKGSYGLCCPRLVSSRQVTTRVGRGLHPDQGVIIELDGRHYHDTRRDQRRDNQHVLQGLTTLCYGWEDVVHRPCVTAREIAGVLTARRWSGHTRPCRRGRGLEIYPAGGLTPPDWMWEPSQASMRRTRPSWTHDATATPSWKRRPVQNPRAPEADGETMS